jgi:hypothetical protein
MQPIVTINGEELYLCHHCELGFTHQKVSGNLFSKYQGNIIATRPIYSLNVLLKT